MKYFLNHGTFGLWVLTARQALVDLFTHGSIVMGVMETIALLIGIIWGGTRVFNGIANGIVDRRKTRLETEKIHREMQEDAYYTDKDDEKYW
tara:strand:- start:341 stop:616 length:276 start_codon:yes stop_codon:yes gene_type:complete